MYALRRISAMKKKSLKPAERDFLSLVSSAAFSNPFGEDRIRLDLQISGLDASAPPGSHLGAALERLRRFLAGLQAGGRGHMNDLVEDERQMLASACLFDVFHQFMDNFDRLIRKQIDTGDASQPVAFSRQVLSMLADRGFSPPECTRYFAMFYQLRRAFYFIGGSLVGGCPSMQKLRKSLWNNVFTSDMRLYDLHLWNRMEDFSTLLTGETGTGKGAAAAAIGRSGFIPFDPQKGHFSESFMRSFLAINLSQFPESLIESELFGHTKGAFTGAVDSHSGVFARCSPHGAIFLDEIGDVSIPIQIKLLQILQERTFSPVGSHARHRFQGRVIAATNKPLQDLRRRGVFRDDFFYRLSSDIIELPTLRQRLREEPAELNELLSLLVARTVGEPSEELARMVREAVVGNLGRDYAWPGNVRELEQSVRRVFLTRACQGDYPEVSKDLQARIVRGIAGGTLKAQELVRGYCKLLYGRYGTYEEVARRTGLDRRTVKKHVCAAGAEATASPPG
jgi:DNA-binding NtrC family response regulator